MPMPKSFKTVITLIALCFTMLQGRAQQADSGETKKAPGYIASYWHNGIALIGGPLKWSGDDWAKFGGTIAITTVIVSMDEPVSQPFFNWQTEVGKSFGKTGKLIGSVPFQLGISGLALGTGALAHSQPMINFALDNLQAQVYTGGLTLVVKELAHRARPDEGQGAYSWLGPFKKSGPGSSYESFFSGHASLSYCTATMIFLHSKKKWWVGVISYTAATGVALSRLQRQSHWASDVVLGSVVGSAVAGFVYRQQEKRRHPVRKLTVIP